MSYTTATANAVKDVWDITFRVSPIILTGGIASSIPGGMLPIAALTNAVSLINGLLTGGTSSISLNELFAHFIQLPGGSLIANDVGRYPFFNQSVAANAVIQQPISVSLQMECGYRGEGYMLTKSPVIMALQSAISNHINKGGLFTVMTPGFIYTDMLCMGIEDVSPELNKPATLYQWDFYRPLTQTSEAAGTAGNLISKLTGGQVSTGSWTAASSGNPFSALLGSIF